MLMSIFIMFHSPLFLSISSESTFTPHPSSSSEAFIPQEMLKLHPRPQEEIFHMYEKREDAEVHRLW